MAAALLAYSNSFASGFIFDNRILLQDPRITAATAENLRLIATRDYWYSLTATGLYRPLATLSYLVNFAVLGDGAHPAGWHWINFGLHAANLALVYALSLLLFEEIAPAFALAALWALHPVLTESVTNIIGRTDLLSALGVLAGLLCHARAAEASGSDYCKMLKTYNGPHFGFAVKNYYAEFLAALQVHQYEGKYFPGIEYEAPIAPAPMPIQSAHQSAHLIKVSAQSRHHSRHHRGAHAHSRHHHSVQAT